MIKYWFPTLISYEILEDLKKNNGMLERKAISLFDQAKDSFESTWACSTFNTLGLHHYSQDQDLTNLVNIFRKKVLEFSKEFGVEKSIDSLECTDFWFNVSKHGDYQEFHRHANSHFSIVYYISVPKNSGDLVFQSFETNSDMFTLPNTNVTDASCKTCVYEPAESALVIFRSNLIHMVKKNLSNSNRISISANFKFN